MPTKTLQSFKHIIRICFLLPAVLTGSSALADKSRVDLLAAGKRAWDSVDTTWNIDQGKIAGATRIKNGAITDPAASTFLVSKAIFGGDIVVSMDVTFETGRYLGVYLDFGQDTQTGIWMATGHALAEDAAANEVEHAYIKTVEDSFWVVRATGELPVESGVPLHLRFARKGDYYSIFDGDTLVVTYRKPGGYPAGPLQIRLTNARARIHRLEVESDWID
jgi:hypothetical protein